ncbi:CgeB family protein [Flavobacterium terrae]|uniref:Spore maturation protein CgeB n=1 Tax=Flavobacterium terrae TaxID=415425 RepID=A0A1M6FTA2_9FLAO|nr:glycosyltransferase [Flavobacterium terrae]SHJ00922.1 spore maturation protein CgeB [Flavobacterium terrae]
MKIALLGSKNFDSLEFHINDTLVHMGHEVHHVDMSDVINIPYKYNYWATKLFPKYDSNIFKKIAHKIISIQPDLVICTYRFINPICIKIIKNNLKSTPVIHINPDAVTTFGYQQIFASEYDAYFTKDPFIVNFMKDKMGLNAFYLPEALNSRYHKSPNKDREILESEINIDVVAFGTMYPYRSKMIDKLIDSGINVSLFGVPDKRFPNQKIMKNFRNEYITGERKADVLFGSKIIFNNFHYAEINSANVKFFEIAGIGGFQICDYKPILEEYSFVDLKEFTFKTIDQAIELIRYYIDEPTLRYKIAFEQQAHFTLHHTYEKRLEQILKIV